MTRGTLQKLSIIILVVGLGVVGFSQQVSEVKKDVIYLTTNDAKVRESPPSKGYIFIGSPGKELFSLKKGEEITIGETRVISTIFSKTIWVRIRKKDSTSEGWVYWGDKTDQSVNFKLK